MRAWQEAGEGFDRTDLVERTAVDTLAGFQDVTADHIGLGFLESGFERVGGHFARCVFGADEGRLGGVAGSAHGRLAFQLFGQRIGLGQVLADELLDRREFLGMVFGFELEGLLGGFFSQVDDRIDDRLNGIMTGHDSAEHHVFRQFIGFRFHHHHGIGCAGHDEVEFGFFELIDGRVDDVLTILVANASSADRAHERGAGQDERGRRADHAEDIGIVLKIVGHAGKHDLDFVLEALDEERADRTVDQARGQRLFFGRATFTLEEAAWDAA